MARASHGVLEGSWYCEMTFRRTQEASHVRCVRVCGGRDDRRPPLFARGVTERPPGCARRSLGWVTRHADLQGPVGMDEHGFGFRDISGCKVHRSNRTAYGEPFGASAVCGGVHTAAAVVAAAAAAAGS